MTTAPHPAPGTEAKFRVCPFCGGGTFDMRENGRTWLGMRYSEPVSFDLRHWCAPVEGQPSPRMLSFAGRDEASAIAAWNRRAPGPDAAGLLAALEATLIFHSGGEWDAEKSARWKELTENRDATTKGLCDMHRAAIAKFKGETT